MIHLKVTNLQKRFGGNHVLKGVNFEINGPELIGLIGPNGAGKSTLLKTAAGLLPLDAGACRINGASINSLPVKARARSLSCLPQARPLYWALSLIHI